MHEKAPAGAGLTRYSPANQGEPEHPAESFPSSYSQAQMQPIVQQPTATFGGQINYAGLRIPDDCPSGLQYLVGTDQLLITKQVGLTGVSTYFIQNNNLQNLYNAAQQGGCFSSGNKLTVVYDGYGNEVMHLQRDYSCTCVCIPCCCCPVPMLLQNVEVYAPPGCLIGVVKQRFNMCSSGFDILDGYNNVMLRIEITGSCALFNPSTFEVTTAESVFAGNIWREYGNLFRRAFSGVRKLGVSFSPNLDIRSKALMMAASILIDSVYNRRNTNA